MEICSAFKPNLRDGRDEVGLETDDLIGIGGDPRPASQRDRKDLLGYAVFAQADWPVGSLPEVNLPRQRAVPAAQALAGYFVFVAIGWVKNHHQ